MLSLSFPTADVVEAARGRILSMFDGDASMHPELTRLGLWDIELASCHGSRDVGREIFADVFPASGGSIPAGGETEVLGLIHSAFDGAEEFRAHVECAHAFFMLQQGSPGAYSWEYDWETELTETHDRLAQLLKTNWRPWQGLRIKEERPGAYRLLITHALEFDRDITAEFTRLRIVAAKCRDADVLQRFRQVQAVGLHEPHGGGVLPPFAVAPRLALG